MMDFEKFTEAVLGEVRKKAEGAFQVRITDTVKNNGVKLTGILAVEEKSESRPCVYLNDFYEDYRNGEKKLGRVTEEIYRLLIKHLDEAKGIDISGFRDWETVRDSIYAKLVNAEWNREQLKAAPHRIFLDMAVVYYVALSGFDSQNTVTALIRNEHMKMWEQDEESLYQRAICNMRSNGRPDFESIEMVVKRILGNVYDLSGNRPEAGMYILSNGRRCFGASEILDRDTLRVIADKMGDGFIVLPSSVHELIVLPYRDELEYGELADMVREVNDTQVSREERLSYHVYAYSESEEALRIVA